MNTAMGKLMDLRQYIDAFRTRTTWPGKHVYLVATRWWKTGIDPHTAAAWSRAQYTPAEALPLIRAGASWRTVASLTRALTDEIDTVLWIETANGEDR